MTGGIKMKGSVYQRKSDGRWVGTVDIGTDSYGKRKRKTLYGKTKKEVQTKIVNLIFEIQNGLYIDGSKDTLVSFLKDYVELNSSRWQETTCALYKMYIEKHIEPYFLNKKLESIKPIDLDKFYNYKLQTLSNNSVIKLHKFLKASFNYGVMKDMLKTNICDKATPPKFVEYNPITYNEEQFAELWSYVQDKYDRVPIALGAGLGLRRGEIFGLTWNNIDFKNGTITIDKTRVRYDKNIEKSPKNVSSNRTIHVPQYVMDTLKSYKSEEKIIKIDNYVLPITPAYYSQRFSYLLNKFGLPHIRLHDLRHFNATIMMNNGVPDKVAAKRLGHKDTTMLHKIYQHVQIGMDIKASDTLNNIFSVNEQKNKAN
jgi:integrase